jgi:cell division protein FtsL
MKTYRIPTATTHTTGVVRSLNTDTIGKFSWKVGVAGAVLLVCAGVTVFASARVMVSSHALAALHTEQSEVSQEIRTLETQYGEVSSLERVRAYAAKEGLTNSHKLAGTLSESNSVAARTQ